MKKSIILVLLPMLMFLGACGSGSSSDGGDSSSVEKFPSFTGLDLAGKEVSSDIFSENSVTVLNFWFSSCPPCIRELPELDALNDELHAQGGAVIGVNTDTLGGERSWIEEALKILKKQGASYRNIYFDDASGEAMKFAQSISTFPTTYLLDRSGNIIGDPMVGSIDNDDTKKMIRDRIDKIIEQDNAG